MIVKNEESVLKRALDSVKDIVDEIIIVDTGSTDKTKSIAFKYTDHVYDYIWCNDFARARNYSFSKATMDYCMWLDADDIITNKDRAEFIKLKSTLSLNTSVVMMKYNTAFDALGNPTFTYYRERLMRRKDNYQWTGFVHEVISPRGKIEYSDIAITHQKIKQSDANRNLNIYRLKLKEGVIFTPRETYYYARELYYHKLYEKAITEFKRFLNSSKGWVEDKIAACQLLSYCYYHLKNQRERITWLLHSLYYDVPRAEICCDIGKYFYERKMYNQAIYWYCVALSCKRNDQSGSFVMPDCYDYIPNIQLCICYDALKEYKIANMYNEFAGKCKPNDKAYLQNKQYFKRILEDATN